MDALKRLCELPVHDQFNREVILVSMLVDWVGSILKLFRDVLFDNSESGCYQTGSDFYITLFGKSGSYRSLFVTS